MAEQQKTEKLKTDEEKVVETYNKLKSSHTDQYIVSNFLPQIIEEIEQDSQYDNKSKQIIAINKNVDPFLLATFLNTSGADQGLRSVFNTFNNAQLSALTPEIKIIVRRRTGPDRYETKYIPIQNLQPTLDPLKSPEITGATMGLKEVNFELGGTSPETARNDINATAVFYGNTLGVFQEHKEYVDLIIPHFEKKDGTDSEVLFQVGWNVVSDPSSALNYNKTQKAAIKGQFQTYVMSYVSHNFSFNEDGSFILQVEYVSYIDGIMRDANFLGAQEVINDVYDLNVKKPPVELKVKDREKVMNYIKENHDGATGKNKQIIYNNIANGLIDSNIVKFKELLDERAAGHFEVLFDNIYYTFYQVPLTQMNTVLLKRACARVYGNDKVHDRIIQTLYQSNAGTNNLNLLDFMSDSDATNLRNAEGSAQSSGGQSSSAGVQDVFDKLKVDSEKKLISNVTPQEPEKFKLIKVTTLGKVLEAFIENSTGVKDLMKEKDFTLVLGTIKITDSGDRNGKVYSLYDLPIAEETIKEVVRKYYVSKIKTKVTLRGFLSYLLAEVRKNYLQGDLILDAGKKLSANSLRSVQMTCSRAHRERIRNNPNRATLTKGIRSDIRDLNISKLANLYFVTAGPASDDPDYELDSYVVGAANSIVKKVNFTQANSATMQARRDENVVAVFRDGSNLGVLPQLYNADLDIVGNLNFLPGYVFNLTPTILGVSANLKDSILKDLGLLGSYMTIKVEHSFSASGFTTKLNAYNISTEKYIKKTLEDNSEK